jgi:hypothetical protein
MADISNKALAVFLLVAMIISLSGFLAVFSNLGERGLTGRAASDTGQSNFSINATISVVFTTNLVNFGAGNVNASGPHNCTLNTSTQQNTTDCIGFLANQTPLIIQNQGTQNVTLNVSFNSTPAQFIGGTSPAYTFNASNDDVGSCGATLLNTVVTSVASAATNYSVCNSTGFNWITNNRTLAFGLGLRIPQDAPSGQRFLLITAYAASP